MGSALHELDYYLIQVYSLTETLTYLGLVAAALNALVAASTFFKSFTLLLCSFNVFFTLSDDTTCSSCSNASCSRSSNTWNALTNEPRIPVSKGVSRSKNRVRIE